MVYYIDCSYIWDSVKTVMFETRLHTKEIKIWPRAKLFCCIEEKFRPCIRIVLHVHFRYTYCIVINLQCISRNHDAIHSVWCGKIKIISHYPTNMLKNNVKFNVTKICIYTHQAQGVVFQSIYDSSRPLFVMFCYWKVILCDLKINESVLYENFSWS